MTKEEVVELLQFLCEKGYKCFHMEDEVLDGEINWMSQHDHREQKLEDVADIFLKHKFLKDARAGSKS